MSSWAHVPLPPFHVATHGIQRSHASRAGTRTCWEMGWVESGRNDLCSMQRGSGKSFKASQWCGAGAWGGCGYWCWKLLLIWSSWPQVGSFQTSASLLLGISSTGGGKSPASSCPSELCGTNNHSWRTGGWDWIYRLWCKHLGGISLFFFLGGGLVLVPTIQVRDERQVVKYHDVHVYLDYISPSIVICGSVA